VTFLAPQTVTSTTMLYIENYVPKHTSIQSRRVHKSINIQIDEPDSKTNVIEDENLDLLWLQIEE